MNYQKHYDLLIERSKNRNIDGYVERHHILPKCMGGSNDKDNIAVLTPEEHYLAHQLLVKMYPDHDGLIYAANMMCTHNTNNRMNNKLFGWLKRKRTELIKGKPMSDETRLKISIAMKGRGHPHTEETKNLLKEKRKYQTFSRESIDQRLSTRIKNDNLKHSDETKKLLSDMKKGIVLSDEHKKVLSDNHWTKRPDADLIQKKQLETRKSNNKQYTDEMRLKLSKSHLGIKHSIIICPHCGKEGGSNSMRRWHFDNCKQLSLT